MAALIAQFMYERASGRKPRTFRDRSNPLETHTEQQLIEMFGLGRTQIMELCEMIREDIDCPLNRKGWVPPIMQVMVALAFLANGTIHSNVGKLFGISKATNHRIVFRVTEACLKHARFNLPRKGAEAQRVKDRFYQCAGFPNVVGCIDGTHIDILTPSRNEHEFLNRKMTHSINVQVVCDARLRVTNLVSKWPGSVSDARILSKSGLFTAFEDVAARPLEGFILGDDDYTLRDWLLTPVPCPRNEAEESYNRSHRLTRCRVDRTISLVKQRWQCLRKELRMTPERACKVIYVCFWLHNLAVDAGLPMDVDSTRIDEEEEVDAGNDADEKMPLANEAPSMTDDVHYEADPAARQALIDGVFAHSPS